MCYIGGRNSTSLIKKLNYILSCLFLWEKIIVLRKEIFTGYLRSLPRSVIWALRMISLVALIYMWFKCFIRKYFQTYRNLKKHMHVLTVQLSKYKHFSATAAVTSSRSNPVTDKLCPSRIHPPDPRSRDRHSLGFGVCYLYPCLNLILVRVHNCTLLCLFSSFIILVSLTWYFLKLTI